MSDKVTYKLLGTVAPSKDEDEVENDDGDLECEVEVEQLFLAPASSYNYRNSYGKATRSFSLGLPQLRIILYFTSLLLVVIFLAQLSTNDRNNGLGYQKQPSTAIRSTFGNAQSLNSDVNYSKHYDDSDYLSVAKASYEVSKTKNQHTPTQVSSALHHNIATATSSNNTVIHSLDTRPEYDSYLSSVILERNSHSNPPKEFIDDLHFPNEQFPDQSLHDTFHEDISLVAETSSNHSRSAWWITSFRNNNKYITLTNYIRAMKSFKPNSSVSLTTQATTEFMYHTLELCERWDGPISIAIFSPGKELSVAITLIKYMRECLPAPLSACIRDKVTWHLVYNRLHGPSGISSIDYPKKYVDSKNYPLFANQDKCPKLHGPEPSDTIIQLEKELSKKNSIYSPNYRQLFKLTYPINVLRNVARLAANTHYVLALDIELYPSINLVPSFINYIQRHNIQKEYKHLLENRQGLSRINHIFTLPIFEVKSNCQAPKTKPELIKMIQNGDAVFFHKWVCDACQNFPNRLDWLQHDVHKDFKTNSSIEVVDMEVKIFELTKRDKTRDSWEPIFIGTNDDPLYDDRLSWDGRRDKMAQMYEMCLKDYYLFILGNAFLVHAPGIKHIDKNDTMKRLNYIRENNGIYDETIAKLKLRYKNSRNLNEC